MRITILGTILASESRAESVTESAVESTALTSPNTNTIRTGVSGSADPRESLTGLGHNIPAIPEMIAERWRTGGDLELPLLWPYPAAEDLTAVQVLFAFRSYALSKKLYIYLIITAFRAYVGKRSTHVDPRHRLPTRPPAGDNDESDLVVIIWTWLVTAGWSIGVANDFTITCSFSAGKGWADAKVLNSRVVECFEHCHVGLCTIQAPSIFVTMKHNCTHPGTARSTGTLLNEYSRADGSSRVFELSIGQITVTLPSLTPAGCLMQETQTNRCPSTDAQIRLAKINDADTHHGFCDDGGAVDVSKMH
ncbi:hypothetical protein K438DRAFT_1925356 [Mycena galopus ATCC 62051]|nr:hypothetical protein K438DRAFT_1925356 [Mycena galopus ATCC 62051]